LVLGVIWLAVETALILRPSAVGIGMDVRDPALSLLRAAKLYLPALFARVALIYALGGSLLGALAAALGFSFATRRRAAVAAIWVGELCLLLGLLLWDRAIARPALFDDLALGSRAFSWVVSEAEPWQPRLALGLLVAAHGIALVRKLGKKLVVGLAAVAVAMAVAAVAIQRPRPPANHHPLIVVVGLDAFRPDRLALFGGSGRVAPNVEAFARDATLFTRAYTPLAQTEPAWRSLLTGRWPHRTGVRYPLTAEHRWEQLLTFPEQLGRSGYATAFYTDCSRFNYQGPQSGFALRVQPPRGAANFVLEKMRLRGVGVFADNALGSAWVPELVDNRALAGIYDPVGYAHRLADALVATAQRGPTLFAYHAASAHFPGDPVYPFYRRFVNPSEPLERRIRMHFSPILTGSASPQGSREGSEALYDELLAQADHQLGILLEALKRAGLYDEALIVVFSDHGEGFFADLPSLAGATPAHGARLGDEENRILLAIKLPSSQAHRSRPERVENLVRLIDIGPTLLELSGSRPLPDADGVSLVPLLQGRQMAALNLLAETGFTHAMPDVFDPDHAALAPRSLDAYDILPDGRIEVSRAVHQAIMAEKDFGAFDGRSWIVRRRMKDGRVVARCSGECDDPGLMRWFESVLGVPPAGS
jgi:arylsulfatase A-like enzyme